MSQLQLSAAIDVRRSAVSNWEAAHNNTHPTMINLVAIAHVCHVSIEWLGTGRGSMSFDGVEEIPAADVELVEERSEREMLGKFRTLPSRSQDVLLDLMDELLAARRRKIKG